MLANSRGSMFQINRLNTCANGVGRLIEYADHLRAGTRDLDAVILDLDLPDSHGIDSFDQLFALAPNIPILVLVGAKDEAVGKSAVQRGAQDYLLKDRLDDYLLPKIIYSMIE